MKEGHLAEGLQFWPHIRGHGLVDLQLEPPVLVGQVDPVNPVVGDRISGESDENRSVRWVRLQLDGQIPTGVGGEDETSESRLPPELDPDGGQALVSHVGLEGEADPLAAIVIHAGKVIKGSRGSWLWLGSC